MKARVESARKSLSQRTRLTFALFGIILAALLVVGLTSAANPAQIGIFELDGNGFAEGNGADWNCLFGTPTASCPLTPQPVVKAKFEDKTLDTTDDILGGGSKDILDIPQWNLVSQKPPAKDDLAHAAWANYNVTVDGAPHDILYFTADRISNNGDAFLGFWFFKNKISVNADGSFNGQHEVGDTLVLVNFVQGQGGKADTQEIGVFVFVKVHVTVSLTPTSIVAVRVPRLPVVPSSQLMPVSCHPGGFASSETW